MWIVLLVFGGLLLLALRSNVVIGTGLLETGLRAEFMQRYDGTSTYWQDLTTRIGSTKDAEKYPWLGSTPQMREWGTGRLAKGLLTEMYSVRNAKYEATIEVDRDEIDDDETGGIRMRVNELAARAADHKDFLVEELFKNGESTGFNSYDGVSFFNAAHVSGDSGEQSNVLTYPAVDADNPTLAEFRGALTQAIAAMVAFKDDRGLPMRIKPTPQGFVCVVPPTMMFTAMESLCVAMVPDAEIAFRPNILRAAARVITMPGLTDASKWYLCKTDVPVRPFIFQDRAPVEFKSVAENSEEEFKREKYLYGVRARYAMTFAYWQFAIATDFTT